MFHSLRFRFALICIGLAVGPLIIVGAVIGVRNFNTLEQQSLILQRKVAENVGSEIRGTIERWENELVLLDEVYGLGVLELKEQRAILRNTLLHQRAFQEVVLLDSEGQEQIRLSRNSVILDDDLQSRAGNEEFLFPATSGGTYLGPVRFDDTIREPLATISVPVYNRSSGELVSVLVAELRFKAIWYLLNDLELASGEEVYVIDQAGLVVAHRHPAVVLSGTTIELPEVDGRAEDLSGTDVIVARHNLQFGNQELVVVAEQHASDALELATRSLGVMVSVICSALTVALILTVYASRRTIRPIEALATSALTISKGDFSQQVKVSSRDEVGQLASAFNQMVSDLRTTTTSIDNLNKEVTERKRAEEEIRKLLDMESQAAREWQETFDAVTDIVTVISPRHEILKVNRAGIEALGKKPEELIGKTCYKLIHGLDGPIEGCPCAESLKTGKGSSGEITERGRHYIVTAWPIFDEGGEIVAFTHTMTDITERKQVEEALQKTLAELECSNAELERFAYIASHDLQEPLRMVASYTQLLEKRYKDRLDADANDFIGYAVDGAKRMQQLINDLLTYSRVGTKGKPLEPTECMTVFEAAVANLDVAIRESGAEVTSDPLPTVMADERQLVQLFQNLIGNAVKFHGIEPPRVHVSAEQSGDEWVFSVRDNGVGIESQYLERVFMAFQRLHGGEYPGTGIGLSIAKRIVERHGGRIWLESEPGKGSTVYFTTLTKGGKQS